jgi:hypothetical protein
MAPLGGTERKQGGDRAMRRLLWLMLLGFSVSSTGCILHKLLNDKPGITKMGGSSKARQIESDLDWESL